MLLGGFGILFFGLGLSDWLDLELVFFTKYLGLLEFCPDRKMMEHNTGSNWDIQACSLVGVLRYINEIIAKLPMHGQYSGPFVTKEESSASCKRMCMDGFAILSDFYSAYFYLILNEVFLCFFKAGKRDVLDVLICTLITEHIELFHDLHFLTAFRSIRYIENFRKSESACASQNVSNIIFLTDIVQEQVSLGDFFLHL